MPEKIKPLDVRISGGAGFDARSEPDEIDLGGFRYVKNIGALNKSRRCRIPGWDKLLTKGDYNNQDLHDQLQAKTGFSSRLPVTFLFEAISTRKSTKLIAGTQNALYALNVASGNWKIISDRLGADGARWRAAQLSDTVIFTNNKDRPIYWQFDQGITESNDQSAAVIPGLDKVGLTKVGLVVEWSGHIFLMNVVVNGTTQAGGVYWCNYEKPLDWIPNEGSTAGNANLGYGETILNALPLSNRLIIYTNKRIWEVQAVGGEAVFSFSKRYDPERGESCLFYPNTLISKGDEHVYAGIDGIYTYSLYQVKPQRVEWMHKASSVMFDYINKEQCEVHIAAYNSQRKEILFSYAKNDETLPSETLVFSSEYPWSYVLDHGFSAMANYTLKSQSQMVRDFLLRYCICDESGLDTYWAQFTKEGGYCTAQETVTCTQTPVSIYTSTSKTIEYDGETVEVEDYDQASADADSLCGIIGNATLSSLCESEIRQDECNSGLRFVAASSRDHCLKEFSQNYYREKCIDFTGCGSFSRLGYQSLLRSGPISVGEYKFDKEIHGFSLEASAGLQGTPSQFTLRIGRHSQAVDPNFDDCGIVWDEQDAKDIACLGGSSPEQHINQNTIPDETYYWPLFYQGGYLYFELSVVNANASPPDTGGSVCVSRFTVDMRAVARNY